MQRNEKICKIIQEFSLFILENCDSDFTLEVNQTEQKSVLTFTMNKWDKKIKKFITDNIKNGRNVEIEEYGWQLMGEGSSDDDFGIINALIDEVHYEETENNTIVRLVRNE